MRRFFFSLVKSLLVLLFIDWPAEIRAADISSGMLTPNLAAIYLKGEMNVNDVRRFAEVVEPFQRAIVFLESPGGVLSAGIAIGITIQSKGLSTFVPENATCASACAIAWLGGIERFATPKSRIGFHAAYDSRTGNESGVANAILGAYLSGLGLSFAAIEFVTEKPPDELNVLTLNNAKARGINVQLLIGTPTAEFLSAALPVPELSQSNKKSNQNLGTMAQAALAQEQGDYVTALQIFRQYAERGEALAQFGLGFMYWNGQGIPQNYSEAVKWYGLAADQGNARAQYNLGVIYATGVSHDYAQAAKWFRSAADQGYAPAQYNLAQLYDKGLNGSRDPAEAIRWYRRAADQNSILAQINLGFAYSEGKDVPQDYSEAVKWYRRAAEQGNPMAQFNLAQMYSEGKGVEKQHGVAAMWLRRAANQGYPLAQNNLGNMYKNGEGLTKNYAEAEKWFRRAAEQGEMLAQFNLGLMYANAQGVAQDYVVAHMWLNLAAVKGEPRAIRNRDVVVRRMTPAQIEKAQRLAQEWKPKPDRP